MTGPIPLRLASVSRAADAGYLALADIADVAASVGAAFAAVRAITRDVVGP